MFFRMRQQTNVLPLSFKSPFEAFLSNTKISCIKLNYLKMMSTPVHMRELCLRFELLYL